MPNIDVSTLSALRSRVKTEFSRRNGYGAVNGYGSASYDFSLKANDNITPEEFKKAIEPILSVKDIGTGYNKTPSVGLPVINIEAANKFLDTLSTESYTGPVSSCRSACTGLCLGCCTGTCTGCSGACNVGCQGCTGCSVCDTGCAAQ